MKSEEKFSNRAPLQHQHICHLRISISHYPIQCRSNGPLQHRWLGSVDTFQRIKRREVANAILMATIRASMHFTTIYIVSGLRHTLCLLFHSITLRIWPRKRRMPCWQKSDPRGGKQSKVRKRYEQHLMMRQWASTYHFSSKFGRGLNATIPFEDVPLARRPAVLYYRLWAIASLVGPYRVRRPIPNFTLIPRSSQR